MNLQFSILCVSAMDGKPVGLLVGLIEGGFVGIIDGISLAMNWSIGWPS